MICRSPASAIVAPFNYKPSPAAAAVKRNTSYVSSIGRRREEEVNIVIFTSIIMIITNIIMTIIMIR